MTRLSGFSRVSKSHLLGCFFLLVLLAACTLVLVSRYEGEEGSNYGYTICESLRIGAFFLDPEIRQNFLSNALAWLEGRDAQFVRLLLWASERSPSVREELVTQFVLGLPSIPEKGELCASLAKWSQCIDDPEAISRWEEIDRVYESIGMVKLERRQRNGTREGRLSYDLSPLSNTAWCLGGTLFELSSQERLRIYERLPKPFPSEGGDEYVGGLVLLLWMVESNGLLRNESLLPVLREAIPDLRFKLEDPFGWLEDLTKNMTEEETNARKREILFVYPEFLAVEETVSDASREGPEQSE